MAQAAMKSLLKPTHSSSIDKDPVNHFLVIASLGILSSFSLPGHAIHSTAESAPAPAEHAADGAEKQIAGFIMSE